MARRPLHHICDNDQSLKCHPLMNDEPNAVLCEPLFATPSRKNASNKCPSVSVEENSGQKDSRKALEVSVEQFENVESSFRVNQPRTSLLCEACHAKHSLIERHRIPELPPVHDYDELWKHILQEKQQNLYDDPFIEMKDDSSSITTQHTNTTTLQPDKQSRLYGEQMLHPRWIAIQEKKTNLRLAAFEAYLGISDSGMMVEMAERIDPLLVRLNKEEQERIEDQLKYLQSSKAIEAQWENNLWRRFFFKDANLSPMHPEVSLCGHQIAQARMVFNDECALPPLLATQDSRRKSRVIISETPWDPDLEKSSRDGSITWYPDYLYAVSLSSLHLESIDSLPGIRLAQYECAPAYLLIEIKNSIEKEFAAKQYMAFLGAYTLHERLLLRLAALSNPSSPSTPPSNALAASFEIDQALSLYVMTCCGPVCRIWNMHVREMPQSDRISATTGATVEPIRYDLELLDAIDIQDRRKHARLAAWINAIHAFGAGKHLDAVRVDAAAAQDMQGSGTMDWTRDYAFVYDYSSWSDGGEAAGIGGGRGGGGSSGSGGGRRIRPVRKADMQSAYDRHEFEPDEKVAGEVIDFVENGRMALVASRSRSRPRKATKTAPRSRGKVRQDLLSPPLSEVGGISITSCTKSSLMIASDLGDAVAGGDFGQIGDPVLVDESQVVTMQEDILDLGVACSSVALEAIHLDAGADVSSIANESFLSVPPEPEPVNRSARRGRRVKGK